METAVVPSVLETFECLPEAEENEPRCLEPVSEATHVGLRVCPSPGPPSSKIVCVSVLDASSGSQETVYLKGGDTVGKLRLKYLQKRPELRGNVRLAYNGKPVPKTSSLAELGVKSGGVFITYRRCTGG